MDEKQKPAFVFGFVSLLGRPNSGKSTLLNALVGTKLAIVADKPQTTRTSIQGVLTLPQAQIVFLDTPGIHKTGSPLNKRMLQTVRDALTERDLLLFLADALAPFTEADRQAVDMLKHSKTPAFLLLNKVDRLKDKGLLLPLIEHYKSAHDFVEYIPISALTGEGLGILRARIVARLPEGPPHFPSEYLTDQPERFLAAELIREKIIQETRNEIPHSVAVLIDHWEETTGAVEKSRTCPAPLRSRLGSTLQNLSRAREQAVFAVPVGDLVTASPNLTRISATIYVEKDGQKGIVIGSKGALLKRIGTLARQEMELLLDRKIFLELYVKVRPHWRESAAFLNELDWRSMAGTEAG